MATKARTATVTAKARTAALAAKATQARTAAAAARATRARRAAAAAEATKIDIRNTLETGKEPMEHMMKAGQDAAQKGYEQAVSMTKEQVEKARTVFVKGYEDMTSLSKDNVDAIVKASTIAARGYEVMSKEMMGFAQAQLESNMAAMKAMLGCKTLKEVVEVQTAYTRTAFDTFVAESTKLSDMGVKVANEAFAPITSQVNVAIERIAKPVAA